MSTNINITVSSGDLSDKVKQLQQSARQEQLEKERQQRLEVQGTEQRKAKLEAEGRAPDGSLLYGARFNQPQIERRPAAYRQLGDVFGHFFVNEYMSEDDFSLTMEVTSGDGLSVARVPWPTVEDFPDLLLQNAPEGELLGADAEFGDEKPLFYDNLGRLVSSGGDGFARIWTPSLDSFFAPEDGLVSVYRLQALYPSGHYSSTHVLPTGGENALVIIRTTDFKRAITRIFRLDRDKYYRQDDTGPYTCQYDNSPVEYYDVKFYVKSVEEFHVFAVSTKKVRYIGLAPGTYIEQFKTLPGYKGFELSDLTVTNSNVVVRDYVSRINDGRCAPGGSSSFVSIPYSSNYIDPNITSDLRFNSLVTYKLITQEAGGDTVTPSAYTVFTNPDFYPSRVPPQVTDDFVSSFLPAKAASLKWRRPDSDETPYLYMGTPPTSWDTYTNGPNSILIDFPKQWRKSGRTPVTDSTLGTPTSVWDWGNPAYCRQQALALGFTEADLIP